MPRARRRPPGDLFTGLTLLALLLVILLLAPPVLTWMVIVERLERCPSCRRRGQLRPAEPQSGRPYKDEEAMRWRRPPRPQFCRCAACGARLVRPPGKPLQPATPEHWNAAVTPAEHWSAEH